MAQKTMAQPETIKVGERTARIMHDWCDGSARYRLNRDVCLQRSQKGTWYAYVDHGEYLQGSYRKTPEEALNSLAERLNNGHSRESELREELHAKLMKAVTG